MEPTVSNVLGVLSLMFWALVLVICVKYIVFVLRADNKGEGGILALAALVAGESGKTRGTRLAIPLLLGLFGTGLLFGDGVITPAISVLGAMEGLSEQSPALGELIVPVTLAILVALFVVQRHGAGRIGFAFGPVIMVWFLAIGAIGVRWIVEEPRVLAAVSPIHAVEFLATNGTMGFVIVGLVFLVVTGGEAPYADGFEPVTVDRRQWGRGRDCDVHGEPARVHALGEPMRLTNQALRSGTRPDTWLTTEAGVGYRLRDE